MLHEIENAACNEWTGEWTLDQKTSYRMIQFLVNIVFSKGMPGGREESGELPWEQGGRGTHELDVIGLFVLPPI